MPRFETTPGQVQPHFAARQNEPSPYQVTLVITRLTTTYTTVINLGPSTAPAPVTASLTSPSIAPRSDSPGTGNSGVVIGAVLGSILGALVLITILYKCCWDNRSALWISPDSTSWDDESSIRVGQRGGGGDGFDRWNRKGDIVRKPPSASTRRSRSERPSRDTRSRASTSRSTNYRGTSVMVNNKGMMGWALVPERTTRYERRSGGWGASNNSDWGRRIDD